MSNRRSLTLSADLGGGCQRDPSARPAVAGDAERDRACCAIAGVSGGARCAGRRRGHVRPRCRPGAAQRAAQPATPAPAQVRIGGSDVPFLDCGAGGLGHAGRICRCRRCASVCVVMTTARPTQVEVHGDMQRRADRISADVAADLDQVDFADLSRLWPEEIARGRTATGWWPTSRSASRAMVMSISAWRRRRIFHPWS